MQTISNNQSVTRKPDYVVCMRLYVNSDGSISVVQGNIRLEVKPSELVSLLDGVLSFASVYAALHQNGATNGIA